MIEIIRIEKSTDGTFGVMMIDKKIFCLTLEPEDKGNQHNISCIPEGKYVCKRYHSERFPDTFEITNVPNRGSILFHIGNTEIDTRGCCLLGKTIGKIKEQRAILNSGDAFHSFMKLNEGVDTFEIEIKSI